MSGECLNCIRIGECTETNEERARQHYFCERWEAAPSAVIAARNQIMADFGDQGLQSILTTKPKGT